MVYSHSMCTSGIDVGSVLNQPLHHSRVPVESCLHIQPMRHDHFVLQSFSQLLVIDTREVSQSVVVDTTYFSVARCQKRCQKLGKVGCARCNLDRNFQVQLVICVFSQRVLVCMERTVQNVIWACPKLMGRHGNLELENFRANLELYIYRIFIFFGNNTFFWENEALHIRNNSSLKYKSKNG